MTERKKIESLTIRGENGQLKDTDLASIQASFEKAYSFSREGILIDLREMNFITPLALSAIMQQVKKLQSQGKEVKFCLEPSVEKIFQFAGYSEKNLFYFDYEEADKAFFSDTLVSDEAAYRETILPTEADFEKEKEDKLKEKRILDYNKTMTGYDPSFLEYDKTIPFDPEKRKPPEKGFL